MYKRQIADDADDDVVGNELPAVHELLGLDPDLGAGGDEVREGRITVDLALRSTSGTKRHEGRRRQVEFGLGPLEELVVLRVGARPATLDERNTEAVELLGDAQYAKLVSIHAGLAVLAPYPQARARLREPGLHIAAAARKLCAVVCGRDVDDPAVAIAVAAPVLSGAAALQQWPLTHAALTELAAAVLIVQPRETQVIR